MALTTGQKADSTNNEGLYIAYGSSVSKDGKYLEGPYYLNASTRDEIYQLVESKVEELKEEGIMDVQFCVMVTSSEIMYFGKMDRAMFNNLPLK